MKSLKKLTVLLAWALVALVIVNLPAANGQTATLYTTQSAFQSATGAQAQAIPATDSLPSKPWNYSDYSCISNLTGIGVPAPAQPNGNEPILVTAPNASSYICILGPGWNAAATNISPWPESPTIVANGEDNYLLHFNPPVYAVGLDLITNVKAQETITLTYADSSTESFADTDLGTGPNTFAFVGFKSFKPIASMFVDTTGGASQNEGISGILTRDAYKVGIDIKPGSDTNSINVDSAGVIPVVIFSSPIFDATTILPETIDFGSLKVKMVGKNDSKPLCSVEDVNLDALPDLLCKIQTYESLVVTGSGTVILKAQTSSGDWVFGEDTVNIVP